MPTSLTEELLVSELAEHIIGSEIIKLAAEVNARIAKGEHIYNLTIGDFNPKIFPIPAELKNQIIAAYEKGETNYPAGDGMLSLRDAVGAWITNHQALQYAHNEILIAGGARPLIYAVYQTLVNANETVVFPVPSWNNNHYTYLTHAKPCAVETTPQNKFMPTADELRPHLADAALLALCSPLNPTGTTFKKHDLEQICDAVLEENERRLATGAKPLYVMYDQIYSALTYGDVVHYDPVSLRPAMRPYTVFVDGISKSLSATGVRVGWAFGPKKIIDKMKNILSHIGAWAPKAEQVATGVYLKEKESYTAFLTETKQKIEDRLHGFHKGFQQLRAEGFAVDSIDPEAAIYLTIQLALHGKTTQSGTVLATTQDVTQYVLAEAGIAVVPFSAFGASDTSSWYRLSVGTCTMEDIQDITNALRTALQKLV